MELNLKTSFNLFLRVFLIYWFSEENQANVKKKQKKTSTLSAQLSELLVQFCTTDTEGQRSALSLHLSSSRGTQSVIDDGGKNTKHIVPHVEALSVCVCLCERVCENQNNGGRQEMRLCSV